MINCYNFTDNYDYVCTHLNSLTNILQEKGQLPKKSNELDLHSISSLAINETSRALNERHINDLLIWDLRRMKMSKLIRNLIDVLVPLKEGTYKGICFLIDPSEEELINRVNTLAEEWKQQKRGNFATSIDESCCYCGDRDLYTKKISDRIDGRSIFSVIDTDINQYIFEYLKDNGPREWRENPSSNIYVNQYFDAKKILSDGSMYHLVVYKMALMIQQSLDIFQGTEKTDDKEDGKFDAFICASLNGACLASGLSAIFHKPIVYLKNIGPSITANDEKLIARIRKDKRYVFIFDFMCLGKEYERMKMICNLSLARIVCCAGISYFRFPRFNKVDQKGKEYLDCSFDWNRELKISALFQINAFEEYYLCSVIEERK